MVLPRFGFDQSCEHTAEVATYIGQETLNGQFVLHISVSHPPAFSTANVAELQSCSTRLVLRSAFATRCSNPDFTAPHQGISLPGV
jgi:hypothetical protein